MAYKIIGEDGQVRQHKDKDLLGSDLVPEIFEKTIIDPERRIVEVVTSSDRQDRDGDRIIQEGINHQFARSVLYAHDYGMKFMPIGKPLGNRVEKRDDFMVTVETHQINPPGAYELSDAAWKLIDFGSLSTTSIGFIPVLVTRAESDQMRDELGLGRWGVLFNEIEKLETSWVPVPSNRDAIREAYGKGIITPSEKQLLFPDNWHEINAPKHWAVGIDLEAQDKGTGTLADLYNTEETDQTKKTNKTDKTDVTDKRLEIEKRLDEMENMVKEIFAMWKDIGEKIIASKQEPETGAQEEEPEAQREEAKETKTLSLSKEQVADIAAAAAEIAAELMAQKIGDVVDKRVKYHLGIVD